ncbi:hypothetical protein PHLCEN_2v12905 [Hermanssonia centrifuga]|uniref:FBD domain-containing protein n=1 Tax=Hermanssonia centrifuga TaxID=98765 RepID=A0A2R6NFZ9_9APHY|nr:hypothetical protein PHLCEN_2v12905 [Hermanssonia centrifuga]
MELFMRTVADVPSLTRFIKDVYAPISKSGKYSDMFGWIWGHPSSKVQRQELISLLSTSPSLEAITIRHLVPKNAVSVTPIDSIISSSATSNCIKRLTLHGSSFEARPHPQFCIMPILDVQLPNLEVLCLRGMYIMPTFQLPSLPRLHTLQLVENYYFPSGGPRPPLFTPESLPNLRVVEVFRNHFPGEAYGHLVSGSSFEKLECLHFLENKRCLEVTRWMSADSEIKHLAIGFLSAIDRVHLVCWRFPDALESLTLLLCDPSSCSPKLEPWTARRQGQVRDDGVEILQGVFRCLKLNKQSKAFKKLVLLAKFPGAEDVAVRLAREHAVRDIRILCASQEVEFSMSLDGTLPLVYTF